MRFARQLRLNLTTALMAAMLLCSAAKSASLPPDSAVTGFSYPSPVCRTIDSVFPVKDPGFTEGGFFSADNDLPIDPQSGVPDLFTTNPGTFIITYSVASSSSVAGGSSTFALVLMEKGNVSLQPGHSIRPGASMRLQASGAASYTWNPPSGLSCLYCANPVASPGASTRYCVASQENNCTDTACTDIIVTCFDEDRDLSVPNAFSPNGDGENDQFCLQGWEICNSRFVIEIYDRWGEKVFVSNDPGFCWNGAYRGEPLNAEVYVYLIAASFTDGSTVNRKGNITLLR